MSDKPLTERVHHSPTITQHMKDLFLDYLLPPTIAISVLGAAAIFSGYVATHVQTHNSDIAFCHEQIRQVGAGVDPATLHGPQTNKTCAELFRLGKAIHDYDNFKYH